MTSSVASTVYETFVDPNASTLRDMYPPASYSSSEWENLNIKMKASIILNIPVDDNWRITDTQIVATSDFDGLKDENPMVHELVMVNYTKGADMSKYVWIRSIVIDLTSRVIVNSSHTYEPEVVLNRIDVSKFGNVRFIDLDKNQHQINLNPNDDILHQYNNNNKGKYVKPVQTNGGFYDNIKIVQGFEGIMITVMYINGRMKLSSASKIDITHTESRWGGTETMTFYEMYEHLHGPNVEELFDTSKMYSPYVHIFIMVHPTTLHVSKENAKNGYMVYLGAQTPTDMHLIHEMSKENLNYFHNSSEIDFVRKTPSNLSSDMDLVINNPDKWYYTPPKLSINEANKHLKYGYDDRSTTSSTKTNQDKRLGPGEFLLVTFIRNGYPVPINFRIYSTAYNWRRIIRDNETNLYLQFCRLTTDALLKKDSYKAYMSKYKRKYPIFKKYHVDDIISFTKRKTLWELDTTNNDESIKLHIDRIYNVWVSLLMAVPPHLQSIISEFYNDYFRDRDDLISFVVGMMTQVDEYEELIVDQHDPRKSTPLQRITREAEKRTLSTLEKMTSIKKEEPDNRYEKILTDNVTNLINMEYGHSFYSMVRQMKKYWKNEKNT